MVRPTRTRSWEAAPALGTLTHVVANKRVLEIGCGYGRISRQLAHLGAEVTGVDLSEELLTYARAAEADEALSIEYLHGDATTVDWWDGTLFDGVVCDMALMDIGDLDGTLDTAATVVAPDGWFVFSIFHPCYPGGDVGSASGLPSWPPDLGYEHEGWWTTGGTGVRGHVGAYHRMLSTYLNAALRAGFDLDRVAEPASPVRTYLVVSCTPR